MRILTVNAGSTSLKVETYELNAPPADIAAPPPAIRRHGAVETAADLVDRDLAADVDLVAHRFVAVPAGASEVFALDAARLAALEAVAGDAPLHDAAALRAVRALRALRPDLPQVAVSDSAFHRTLSPAAATYAIPRALTAQGLRRVGFHGLSHQYAAHRAAALARIDVHAARIVTLHLGGGSSLCAVRDARSIDTTMGFTPLEGVPMATRSGSLDPGLILHLLRGGMTVAELDEMLEHRSGLAGISGRTGDLRELLAADDDDARLAVDVLGWRLRAALGAMIAGLGGVDLIAFSGGIGENAAAVRAAALGGATAWGAVLDPERNAGLSGEGPLGPDGARVPAYVVAARENWMLARAAYRFATGCEGDRNAGPGGLHAPFRPIVHPVGMSHVPTATDLSERERHLAVVRERVFIEAPYVGAVGAFERRLGLEPGHAQGCCVLALVAPLAEGREIARDVTATTARLPGTANFTSRYRLAWNAGRSARGIPTPGFEGTITLRSGEDYDECELELDGRYEPPGGPLGKLFDEVVGRRIAHATLGSLLDGVRQELRAAHERMEAGKHGN